MSRIRPASVALGALAAVAILAVTARPSWAPVLPIHLDRGTPVSLLGRAYETRQDVLEALGELAFKSDFLLEGSPMSTVGAQPTCDSCHPDGEASRAVFFEGLSDKPGNIDVTNRAISLIEDGEFNPLNVPSLRGSALTAPFGRDGRFETVRDFTLFAIANEFAGGVPSDLVLDALVAYQESIPFPANPLIDARGRLTGAAPDAARRGEAVFQRPFPDGSGMSCATCHVPADHFLDHMTHDVGGGRGGRAGKAFETPTLLDTAYTAPYMHDGRCDSLGEVVDYFDGRFSIGLSADDRDDLVAYLETVGGGAEPPVAGGGPIRPQGLVPLLRLPLAADDWQLTRMAVAQLTMELRQYGTLGGDDRAWAVDGWIKALRHIDALTRQQDFAGARAALDALAASLDAQGG